MMISAGLGVSVAANPRAIVFPKFIQIVIPMRAKPQRIANEGTHDGANSPVLQFII